MNWSLRARLTAGYTAIVVAVLGAGAIAAILAHDRLEQDRLDEELARLMLTLEGVMRTEINEGLTLEASAEEASIEVVAPDRHLFLARPSADVLASWGTPLPGSWHVSASAPGYQTLVFNGRQVRLFRRDISYKGHAYVAAVSASLDEFDARQRELMISIAVGVMVSLAVAGLGGWWVGRRTLQPLTDMAAQASPSAGTPPRHICAPRGRTTSWGGWRRPSTDCSTGSRLRRTSNASSWQMRRTNCGHRCRSPAPPHRWR